MKQGVIGVSLSLLALNMLGTSNAMGQSQGAKSAPASTKATFIAGKVDLALEEALAQSQPNDIVSALVYMQGQADVQELDGLLNAQQAHRGARNEVVVRLLMQTADANQIAIKDRLAQLKNAGSVTRYESFWLVNALRVDATPASLQELSQRADVLMVYLNPPISNIAPTQEDPAPVRGQAVDPLPIGAGTITPGVAAVRAPQVWAMGFTGQGILVATLDTGAAGTHPAIGARWRGHSPAYAGNPQWAWFDPVTNTTTPQEFSSSSHGTHTMGTVCGGAPGEKIGVAPGAQWIHAAVIDRVSIAQTVADAILSFQWMANPDGNPATVFDVPHVCSNSWGVTTSHGYPNCSTTFWSFIDNSEAAGTVQIFAAGNEGPAATTIRRPADRATDAFRNVAVAATSPHTAGWPIASFSSRGPTTCTPSGAQAIKPDIAAPGVDTRSSVSGGGYGNKSGTSMSTPHVNGVIALMLEACPVLTPEQVKEIIYNTAVDLGAAGKDNIYGWGHIDALEAVLAAQGACSIGIMLPGGAPTLVDPGVPASFSVRIVEGSEQVLPGSAKLFYRYDGGNFSEAQLTHDGGEFYTATLPPALCADNPQFYVQVQGTGGTIRSNPAAAPAEYHSALVGSFVTEEIYSQTFAAGEPAGWTKTGLWNFTSLCSVGTPCDGNLWAYYGQTSTCNYVTGATNSGELVSAPVTVPTVPPGGTATVSFCYTLQTESSTSYDIARFNVVGQPATQLSASPNSWTVAQFPITQHSGQTIQLRWHFDTVDSVQNNFRGWQVDNVRITVTAHQCVDPPTNLADITGDGVVNVNDLLAVIGAWGPCAAPPAPCPADIFPTPGGDGQVNVNDLLMVIGNWG